MIVFGSFAEDRVKSINFDIDIAVDSTEYYKLVAHCLKNDFKIDLIDLSAINPHIKKEILKYGKIIYEKE